jgi:PAS domain S-box-containing protein
MSGERRAVRRREVDVVIERARRALEGTDTGVWLRDIEDGVIRWSEQVGPLHGLPVGAQPGDHEEYLDSAVHPDDRAALDASVKQALAGGEGFTQEFRVALPDGDVRWLGTRAHVVRGRAGEPVELIGLIYDVTERRRREEASALLAEASVALGESLDPFRTMREIAHLAVPGRADWCSVHVMHEDGYIDTVAVAHVDPERRRTARALASRFPPHPAAVNGAPEVTRSGRSELYPQIDEEQLRRWASDDEQFALLNELRPRSAMIVPLLARGRPLGAISFIYTDSGRRYDESDLELAEELGRRAGLALDHARLYERRHRTAATLQQALLPHSVPQPAGYELVPAYVPAAEGEETGGDWYDAFVLPDGRLGLVIGDVVGHGVEAAAKMGQLRIALRAYALIEDDPGRVIDLLGDMARKLSDVSFATVAYVTVAPEHGTLRLASAGHLPPLLVARDGSTRFLDGPVVPPLATLKAVACVTQRATLGAGETLVLYTDGLVEHRERDVDAGMARLAELAGAPLALAELVPRMVQGMDSPQSHDDVAILAVRRAG